MVVSVFFSIIPYITPADIWARRCAGFGVAAAALPLALYTSQQFIAFSQITQTDMRRSSVAA